MSNRSKLSSVDRLVVRLDKIHGVDNWCLGRADSSSSSIGGPPEGHWYLFADWLTPQWGPTEEGAWCIDVHGATLREVLVRALWASR